MLKSPFRLPHPARPTRRALDSIFNFPWFILFIALVILPLTAFGQGSMQRLVRISGDNGNIVSLSAGNPAATYTLTLPPTINPSTTAASVLFGTGSGLLDWTKLIYKRKKS
jgi:ABC-type multidrug transport system permease subunit